MTIERAPSGSDTSAHSVSSVWLTTPLAWPSERARSPRQATTAYRHASAHHTDFADAMMRLKSQVDRLGVTGRVEISTNCTFEEIAAGIEPSDAGVVCNFELSDERFALSCDGWALIPNNIAAIAAHLDAIRWQQDTGIMPVIVTLRGFSVGALKWQQQDPHRLCGHCRTSMDLPPRSKA